MWSSRFIARLSESFEVGLTTQYHINNRDITVFLVDICSIFKYSVDITAVDNRGRESVSIISLLSLTTITVIVIESTDNKIRKMHRRRPTVNDFKP